MNIEQILNNPLCETFAADGVAPNVLAAHNIAHDALKGALGIDPAEAWSLKLMQHTWDAEGVKFHAEFARNPHYGEDES